MSQMLVFINCSLLKYDFALTQIKNIFMNFVSFGYYEAHMNLKKYFALPGFRCKCFFNSEF